jgi:hypothetical protein
VALTSSLTKEVTMKKQTTGIAALAIPLTIAFGLLAGNICSAADNQTAVLACSNWAVSGRFASVATGVLLQSPGLPPEAQIRSIGISDFDGRGNVTLVEHTIINGMPPPTPWISDTGTYSVNPDCTGTMVLNTPLSPVPLHFGLVIVRPGREFYAVLDFSAVTTTYTRID